MILLVHLAGSPRAQARDSGDGWEGGKGLVFPCVGFKISRRSSLPRGGGYYARVLEGNRQLIFARSGESDLRFLGICTQRSLKVDVSSPLPW